MKKNKNDTIVYLPDPFLVLPSPIMEVKEAFSKVLRELRKESSLTQGQLAEYADVETTFISFLERGLRQPTITTIFKIAKGLKMSPVDIIQKVEKYYNNQ